MGLRSLLLIVVSFFAVSGTAYAAVPADTAKAPKVTVKGRLASSDSGEPLGFSVVGIYRSSDSSLVTGSVSDQNGAFTVTYPAETECYLKASCVGSEPRFIRLQPEGTATINLGTIRLKSSARLKEIEIVDDRPAYKVEDDKKVYMVDKDPAAANGAVSDVLQNIPSVFVDMDGNVKLRGGSVRILINGRPTSAFGMGKREVIGFLPANMVETIEVINNPSARFDANGEAGIINIVLKKPKEAGVNGLFAGGFGTLDNYNASGRITFRNRKWSVSVSDNMRNTNMKGTTDRNREVNKASTYYIDQNQEWTDHNTTNVVGGRVGFAPDTLNEIIGSLLYSRTKGEWDAYSWYLQSDASRQLTDVFDRSSPDRDDDRSLDYNFTYNRKFKKKDELLTVFFVHNDSRDNSESRYVQQLYNPVSPFDPFPVDPLSQRVTETNLMARSMFQVDYDLPLSGRRKIECGGKSSYRYTDQDYLFEKYDWNTQGYFNVPGFTNHFRQKEWINAAYFSFRKSFDFISVKGGLRAEQTIWNSELLTGGQVNNRDFINLFPSAYLSKKIAGSNSFSLGYSRRISRPSVRMLNPFLKYVDAITIRTGNPQLSPEFTNSFELSHTKTWKKSTINSSIYYRQTTGNIQRISFIDSVNDAVTTYGNFNFEKDLGVEFYYTAQLNKWYRFNTGFNGYTTRIDGTNIDPTYTSQNLNFNAKINNYFTINSTLLAQLTGNYVAPVVTPVTVSASVFYSDFSLRKDLLGKRLTCAVRISDIFHTRRQNSELLNEVYHIYTYSQRASRQVFFSITYRPGMNKFKNKQKEEDLFPEESGDQESEE
jgi:outer membrane receptor protein involved in Fe transport